MSIELRTEESFADRYDWQDMARDRDIRLPLWRFSCTTGGMRKFLRKLEIPVEEYLAANNEKNLKHFGQMNPDWPLRAWAGLQLEWLIWKDKSIEEMVLPPKRKRGRPKKVVNA